MESDKKPVNMTDVARRAGVNQSTVSRALRGDPALPEATRKRLTKLAEKMGYRRNPYVSALVAERRRGKASGKGAVIAILTPGAKPETWRDKVLRPSYASLYRLMRDQAFKLGYHIEEFPLEAPDMGPERLRRILLARGIRGLVLAPMPLETASVQFDFKDFASIALRLRLQEPSLDRVAPDYFSGMSDAMEKLLETGHRRIAFLSDMDVDERVRHRSLGAYLAARHAAPERCLEPLIVETLNRPNFLTWMRSQTPDAILTPIFANYQPIKDWLLADGWKLPKQLSLVSLDCHSDTQEAGIVHNLELEASSAIKLLTSKVETADFGVPPYASQLAIRGGWRDGDCFAPRSKSTHTKR